MSVRRRPLPARVLATLGVSAAALTAAWALGLGPAGLVPRAAGAELARDLFAAAFTPALDYQDPPSVPGVQPFLLGVLGAALRTVLFAAAAMSLAVPLAAPLALLASDALWTRGDPRSDSVPRLARAAQWSARLVIALLRSVHELLWAILFLSALGLSPASGVVALALPFAGVLAKIGSEMLDEADRRAWHALWMAGVPRGRALALGLFPNAAPDLVSYGFYRFECALRSAAVLGFFGHPTLGLYLVQSFENLHLREVWTYLYAMIALALGAEAWGAAVRRRIGR
ncbi:MAG: ABC transporter permease subunit [Planctomycetota bacterium]